MQLVAAGPIWSRVSTLETDETMREKAYIWTQVPREVRFAVHMLCDPNRVLVVQTRHESGGGYPQRSSRVSPIAENSLAPILWQNHRPGPGN